LGDLAAAGQRARSAPAETLPLAEARLRAPVPQPPSVRDFLSFEEHAKNACAAFGRDVDPVWYSQPVFYFTNPAAVRGPGRHGRVIEPDLHKASDGPLLTMPEVVSCSPALTGRKAGVTSASMGWGWFAHAFGWAAAGRCSSALRVDLTNWSMSCWVSGARTR
jgi:hypothetical protein